MSYDINEEIEDKGEELKNLLSIEVGSLTLGELIDAFGNVEDIQNRLIKLIESLDNIE